ncbi:MAG: hypothetical protein L6R43_14900 [Planctomycetes bacterium]|nr:hypothetical protein [Planctomycetota bacterium]
MRAARNSDHWMQGEYSEQQAAQWAVSTLPEVGPSGDGWQARLVVYQPASWEGGRESRPARIVVVRGTLGAYPQVLWEEERVLEEGAYVNRLYWGEK